MQIGEKIASLRRKKGVTQAQLADQLHFTRQAVSNWERGLTEPDAHTLPVIAAYFGISTDELLGISPQAQADTQAGGNNMDHARKGIGVGNAESVSAAKALRVLLWVYTWLYAAQILFSFSSESGLYILFGRVFYFFAAAASLAVFLLFLFAKQAGGRPALRVAFFVCFAAGVIFSFALLSDNAVLALALLYCDRLLFGAVRGGDRCGGVRAGKRSKHPPAVSAVHRYFFDPMRRRGIYTRSVYIGTRPLRPHKGG